MKQSTVAAAAAAPANVPPMLASRNYDLKFAWLPNGIYDGKGVRWHQTTVKVAATSWPAAVQLALRALALDHSIPDDATVRSIKL